MRHLHWSATDVHAACGVRRLIPVRSGGRVFMEPGHASVHWSKARKSDCPECRKAVRAVVHAPNASKAETPICAQAMGCLCAGHARGAAASEPCDTTE
jgi:hypothetical protein